MNLNNSVNVTHQNNNKGVSAEHLPQFKAVLLGEAGVGKTSLFLRVRDNEFKDGSPSSIGLDSCSCVLKVDQREIKMSLWDTAGVERFRTLTRNFYRNAHAILFSFSLNDPSTLYDLSKWEGDAAQYAPNALRFLVGCKNDIDQLVTKELVENFAKTHGCEYAFITSAKTGQGLPEALATIATRLMAVHCQERYDLENSWLDENVYINQGDPSTLAKKSSCC